MQNILGCYGAEGDRRSVEKEKEKQKKENVKGNLEEEEDWIWLGESVGWQGSGVRRQPGKGLAQAGRLAGKKKVVGDARRRGQSGLASV